MIFLQIESCNSPFLICSAKMTAKWISLDHGKHIQMKCTRGKDKKGA